MVVHRKDGAAPPLDRDGRIVADHHDERIPLATSGMHDGASPDRKHGRPVGIVELDPLVLLEVAAHRRAVAIGLIDVRVVGRVDRSAEPGRAGSPRGLAGGGGRPAETRKRVGGNRAEERPPPAESHEHLDSV